LEDKMKSRSVASISFCLTIFLAACQAGAASYGQKVVVPV
jgi:hypothetical protein